MYQSFTMVCHTHVSILLTITALEYVFQCNMLSSYCKGHNARSLAWLLPQEKSGQVCTVIDWRYLLPEVLYEGT